MASAAAVTTEHAENGSAYALGADPQTETSDTTTATVNTEAGADAPAAEKKWPGWPGDCVFRLIVPVLKVGSIIGRKGELIKKMCEETRARIRVLDGPVGSPDRVVSLIYFT
ncbi:hypothetical protein CsSME_00015143 [Camellia sinensis var. sinensis]